MQGRNVRVNYPVRLFEPTRNTFRYLVSLSTKRESSDGFSSTRRIAVSESPSLLASESSCCEMGLPLGRAPFFFAAIGAERFTAALDLLAVFDCEVAAGT